MDSILTNTDEARNTSRRIRLPLQHKKITTELAEDFSLPDYQPEIRRLLSISATVQPPSRFIGTGNAEFSGTVDYSVLYTGNDGALYCAPLSSEYRFSVPLDAGSDFDLSDAPTVYAICTAESANGRVTAPRKLTVKCRLQSDVRCFATCLIGERYTGELPAEGDLCRLTGECEAAELFFGDGEEITLSDEILPEGGNTDRLRVIAADGKVFPNGVEAGSGEVRCRGEAVITLLVATEPEEAQPTLSVEPSPEPSQPAAPQMPKISVITRKLPFGCNVETDGADVSCTPTVWGSCTELAVSVEEGRILLDVGVKMQALCQKNNRVEYTKDLYAAGRISNCTYTTREIPFASRTGNGNFTAGGSAKLEELGIRPGSVIADATGDAMVEEIMMEKGKPVFSGNCRFRLLLISPDGEFSSAEAVFPFRYEAEGSPIRWEAGEIPDADTRIQMVSCRARMDGERLAADGELALAYRMQEHRSVKMPESVSFGEACPEAERGTLRICYPANGETLWDVAKRYRVPVDALSEKNDLPGALRADDPASLGGSRYLMV